jgi:DNA repair exonuclease SbcCD ATPase subunit
MLDAFKNITGGNKGKTVQKQTDELEMLISTAREERSAISAMLTALTTRSAKLAPLGKSLEVVAEKATTVTTRLDEITKRLSALDDRAKELEEIDQRILALKESARQAEQTTQKAIGPDGELQKHREAVQHLSSQALGTQATLETLKKERATLEELRTQLQKADGEVKQSLGQSSTLKAELDQIRSIATTLTQDYAKIREHSREAREDTTAAMATVKEVEAKLGPLAQLHELSQSTEERLIALNSLAEHVSHKAKTLEGQQQSVEHAVVQANRVNEMVWAMDVQIGKLNEGLKQVARADDTLSRTERVAAESNAQLENATKLRQEVERETGKLKKEATGLLDVVRGQLDTLAVRKKEFEAFDERLKTLQSNVGDAESRMLALTAKDKSLIELTQKVDGLTKRFESLFAQADDLTKKQLSLESLHERLGQVDDLAKKTAWQMDSLRQSRTDLEVLRKDIQEFYKSHAEAAKLAEKLGSDRLGLEAFGDRMTAFSAQAPELESKMNAILGKLKLVEEGTQKATRLHESVAELDAQISRVSARLPFVEKLEVRLNGLNDVSADVDSKLAEQLARRTELETLKAACDGLAAQMEDAQHKLDAVRVLQTTLLPLVSEVTKLQSEIGSAQKRLDGTKFGEVAIIEQEKRYAELVAMSKNVGNDVAERVRQMQVLGEELGRSAKVKDELLGELDRVQGRQRDTSSQIQASEDQLTRAEGMFKQLESRRSQVAFGEKKLAAVETRLAEIKQIATELDKSIAGIAGREALVNAVKAEVENVHQISARSKADLAHVTEHRGEVAALKSQVDLLLSRIGETDERIVAIDAKRKLVDEVQNKANAIVHVLDDVRVNLETLGEQKAVVDHVAERVAQLEFTLQEARNMLRSLQHERELAERIEKGIKQLRAKTSGSQSDESKRTA